MDTSKVTSLSLDNLVSVLTPTNLFRLLGLWFAYRVGLCIYNISPFHPLYRFPGPKLAAISYAYEFWFDFVKTGRYTNEIWKMHDKYGPIVRINPEELHCNDPEFASEIYPTSSNRRIRDKHAHFLKAIVGPLEVSCFGTREHELHRQRRGALARFFSRQQMLHLEAEVYTLAQKMCDKLLMCANNGPLEIIDAFECFTADTISQYAFGSGFGYLDQAEWTPNFGTITKALTHVALLFRFTPIIRNLVSLAPYLAKYMRGDMAVFVSSLYEMIPEYIKQAEKDRIRGRIFTELFESDLPDEEKTLYRLSGEGWAFLSAGTETTANTFTMMTYYLLSKPDVFSRLFEELKDLDPDQLSWVELEQRPYLYGVVYEALRLSYGLSVRLPRVVRDESLQYHNNSYHYVLPPGTAIGMSSVICHHNEENFPNSYEFDPTRWINSQGGRNIGLEKYLMSFGKGGRQCIGMNLALCELYLVTALFTLRAFPRMQLYDTKYEDIAYDHDDQVPRPKSGSRGVRVTIS